MISELEQISKTIPLVSAVSETHKILMKNCPNKLIVMDYTNQHFLKAELHASPQNSEEQIFKNFYIYIHISNLSNEYVSLKKQSHHHEPCLRNSNPISSQNYEDYLIKKQNQVTKTSELFLQKNCYDIKIINLLQSIKHTHNYQIDFQQMNVLIKSKEDFWVVPVENIPYDIHKPWHEPITAQNTLDLLKTQEYLRQVNLQLNRITHHQEKNTSQNQRKVISQQKIDEEESLQNKSELEKQKKIQQLTKLLEKNVNAINSIIQQMSKIKKQVHVQGQKLQIQQNKFIKILDDLNDIKKQNQHKIKLHRLHHQKEPVSDVLRQKLSIDLHSSYLQKFQIKGTLIKYIGEDKQATQLLSSKIYGINQGNKKLKSILKIIYTKGKCIKFGIIDNKYVNQRSAWKYPNIIYLHAWGHTLVGGHERNHDLCDYGTDDVVQLNADFDKGQIQWRINNKSMVILNSQAVKKLLKTDIEWVPFIAMYNNLDCVQWKVCKNQ